MEFHDRMCQELAIVQPYEVIEYVMLIKKALINDHIRVSKVSWKFLIQIIYNFAVIYPRNLPFS